MHLLFIAHDLTTTFEADESGLLELEFRNCKVIEESAFKNRGGIKPFSIQPSFVSKLLLLLSRPMLVLEALLYERRMITGVRDVTEVIHVLAKGEQILKSLELSFDFLQLDVLYSYWFYDPTFMCLAKKKYPHLKLVSRAHGGDIYEERGSLNPQTLRHWQMKYLDKVVTVSNKGREYLQKRVPQFSEKFETIHLGSPEHGLSAYEAPTETPTIVTCAHVRNVKRLHLLAKALLDFDKPLRWTHFGSLNEASISKDSAVAKFHELITKLQKKKNIQLEFPGAISREEIFKRYAKEHIDLFLSVSAHEGLPVSMMEAISFGFPILSTDVGGCSEIVNEVTGKLIAAEFDVNELMNEIEKAIMTSFDSTAIREFWRSSFSQQENSQRFISLLKEL